MKQLLFSALLLLFSISLFAQSAPVPDYRVSSNAMLFSVGIPLGAKVYNTTTKEYWVCNLAAPAGSSLASAYTTHDATTGSFILLNPAEQTISAAQSAGTSVVTMTSGTKVDGTAGTATTVTIAPGGINTVATNSGTGVITITATEDQTLTYTRDAFKGNIAITGTSLNSQDIPKASQTLAGLMEAADKIRLDNMSDNVGVYTHQSFEATDTDVTNQYITLTTAIKTGSETSILVSVNGLELNLANAQYNLTDIATKKINFTSKLPIAKYDAITVTYIK